MDAGRILEGRYELVAPIAQGAMSSVWEARDAVASELVAIKLVSMEEAGWRAEVRDRFQQEARILERVHDEHVVGVRGFGETDDGLLYIVLDRLTGETLAERLARPPRLRWREATRLALELAQGLAALHARGIVHRDLKPANVVLHAGPDGVPVAKLIDLGVSKASAAAADAWYYATLTSTGQVLGTPEYMSYEQALGERGVDARSDVWALGVVLYEMLAGRRPFAGENANAVLAAIRRGPPPDLAEVAPSTPPAVLEVVDRCLERAREGRYADGAVLARTLEAALTRGAVERRRRAWLTRIGVVAAVLLAVEVVALGVRHLRRKHAPPGALPATTATTLPTTDARSTAEPAPAAPPDASSPSMPPIEPAAPPPAGTPRVPARSPKPVTKVNSAGF